MIFLEFLFVCIFIVLISTLVIFWLEKGDKEIYKEGDFRYTINRYMLKKLMGDKE